MNGLDTRNTLSERTLSSRDRDEDMSTEVFVSLKAVISCELRRGVSNQKEHFFPANSAGLMTNTAAFEKE